VVAQRAEGSFPGSTRRLRDRDDAGRRLADELSEVLEPVDSQPRPLILGLPRGGVVVAAAVADSIGCSLDALTVRKVSLPSNPELAVGAVTLRGPVLLNAGVVAAEQLGPADVAELVAMARERVMADELTYRLGRPPADVKGREVILVDDGAATGATIRAAISSVRADGATKVIVAVPVAPRETLQVLAAEADLVVCLQRPFLFRAVGWAYQDFGPVPDDRVRSLLEAAHGR